MVDMVDPRWRARAKSIYAGRTSSNEDTAEADKNLRGGMVSMSNEFTTILFAYASMYATFMKSLDDAKTRPLADAEAIQLGMRKSFDEAIAKYKQYGVIALRGSFLMIFPNEKVQRGIDNLCTVAEAWTLAHELGHHLARDMSVRKDKGAEALLKDLTARSSVRQDIANLPPLQRCEVEADLLATLVLAGHFTKQDNDYAMIHQAIMGGTVSLIAVAHLRDEWTAEREDSHPGCFDRLRILLTIMSEIHGNGPDHPSGSNDSHLLIFHAAATMMTFAQWAQDVGKVREIAKAAFPSDHDAPSLLRAVAFYAMEFRAAAENYRD